MEVLVRLVMELVVLLVMPLAWHSAVLEFAMQMPLVWHLAVLEFAMQMPVVALVVQLNRVADGERGPPSQEPQLELLSAPQEKLVLTKLPMHCQMPKRALQQLPPPHERNAASGPLPQASSPPLARPRAVAILKQPCLELTPLP